MASKDTILGKFMANLWVLPLIGSGVILIEAFIRITHQIDAIFSIILCAIVIIAVIFSRKDVHGTGFTVLICAYIILLSPIGFSGFQIGFILILVGSLFLASGGFFTMSVFFLYVAIGAIVLDLILFVIVP